MQVTTLSSRESACLQTAWDYVALYLDYFKYVEPNLDLTDEYKCPSTQQPGLNMQRMVTVEEANRLAGLLTLLSRSAKGLKSKFALKTRSGREKEMTSFCQLANKSERMRVSFLRVPTSTVKT